MSLEYSFWQGEEFVVYGVNAKGRWMIPEMVKTLQKMGKTAHLVDPRAEEFQGREVNAALDTLEAVPTRALVVIEADKAVDAIEECGAHGVTEVWLDTRGKSEEAAERAAKLGMGVVVERCPFLTMPGAHIGHRPHSWLLKVLGKLPKS